jgi:hypothetical protein
MDYIHQTFYESKKWISSFNYVWKLFYFYFLLIIKYSLSINIYTILICCGKFCIAKWYLCENFTMALLGLTILESAFLVHR